MFNLIGIGERAGSGVPDIYAIWDNQGWKEPEVEEKFGPDRTVLTLDMTQGSEGKTDSLKQLEKTMIKISDRNDQLKQETKTGDKKQAIKAGDKKQAIKTSDKEQSEKTLKNQSRIIEFLKKNGKSKTADIAIYLGLSPSRTRTILSEMVSKGAIIAEGERKYRRYSIADKPGEKNGLDDSKDL